MTLAQERPIPTMAHRNAPVGYVACEMDDEPQLATQASLAAIVESSDDAILSKDLDGIIRSCNAATERMFGYTCEELIGRPVRILIPTEREAEEDDILERIGRGQRIDHFETVRVAKDRSLVDVSLTISPVYDASGAVVGASTIARDITERKRGREKEAYLAAIIESSADAILSKDLNGTITSCNESAERIFGYKAAELVGRPIHVLIPAERYAEEDMILSKVRAGERVEHLETVRITKDGRKVDISLSVSPIRDDSGTIIGVAKVARDITEQKRLARELAAQREYFRVTLSSIGDGVIATDEKGRVTFMNAPAEKLTGWLAGEAACHPLADVFRIINEKTRQPVENPADIVMRSDHVVGLANHSVLLHRDGTEHPIADSAAPIRDAAGKPVGSVLVFRDIGDRRRIAVERRNVAAERERLLNAERAARSDAERASRVKDEFVATVSHELRTPLNAILGWTQLMMQNAADQDVIARGLDVISRNTRLQAQLVSDLLDVSRIVSGKLRLSIEKVDLVPVVRNVIETVQQMAGSKHISIREQLDATEIPIAADPARLQQIIWNLLSNAIKFTPEGGSVLVRLRYSGAGAEVTVKDTGAGIRAEILPHIFERFNQANLLGSRGAGGLGLGLSIVKHLVDLHGGTVKAESPGEGKGTTFTVVLPSAALPDTEKVPIHGLRKASEPGDVLQGLRVLVVEDEADTRDFLGRFLVAHGAQVTTASSAAEAFEQLPDSEADLLISDIGLPEVDGYELLQRIRRTDAGSGGGIPAIALTAYARAEDRARAFRAGYQAHLAKPIEPADLVAAIARMARLSERSENSLGE